MSQTQCPSCGRKLQLTEHLVGRRVQCPSCSQKFIAEASTNNSSAANSLNAAESGPSAPTRPASVNAQDVESNLALRPQNGSTSGPERPDKVQAIAIMTFVGGILGVLTGLGWIASTVIFAISSVGIGMVCCLWPAPYYSVVFGVLAIMKDAALMGESGHFQRPPTQTAIMQIINILNFDITNVVMGIITLVFLKEPRVRAYYRG